MTLPIHSAGSQHTTGPRQIVAIAAGKGGVGKSTVTVNLARALTEVGYRVGILDADLYGPSLRRMLPEETPPRQDGPTFIPAVSGGIKVISMAYFRQDNMANVVRAPIANQLIGQFLNQVEWGPLDILLIDFPPGTGDIQLTLTQKARLNGALMVTTPQQVAVMDVRKAIHLFQQVGVPVLGLVENMSFYLHEKTGECLALFGEGGGEQLAAEAAVPLLGQIPIEAAISHSGDSGKDLFRDAARSSAAVKAFRAIATQLIQKLKDTEDEALRGVQLVNNSQLRLEWGDGQVDILPLVELQRNCPCAACSALRQSSKADISSPSQVGCTVIDQVGRYALKLHFTQGCSNGIYPFSLLRELAKSK